MRIGILAIFVIINSLFSHVFKITVKYPFIVSFIDSTGAFVSDSLVRFRLLKATIYRNASESLYVETYTSNHGVALCAFDT